LEISKTVENLRHWIAEQNRGEESSHTCEEGKREIGSVEVKMQNAWCV